MASNLFAHEVAYRGDDYLEKLRSMSIAICGVGAVGSQLADALARIGFGTEGGHSLFLLDKDRIESSNVASQVWQEADVGKLKADAMANRLFRTNRASAIGVPKELTGDNFNKLLTPGLFKNGLIIDAFDNSPSRRLLQENCRKYGIPLIHIGLSGDSFASVEWDAAYRIPADTGDDPCDAPLSRTLSMLAVAVATEEILDYALNDEPRMANWTITLCDLCIKRMG